ncbi:TPA: hypothetical protein ACGO10_000498 [Streptococcus suis]
MATNLEILHMHRVASYYETMQERYEEGIEKGIERGIDTEKLGTIKRMLKANMSDDMIAIATEFTLEQVANYRSQFQLEKGHEHGN